MCIKLYQEIIILSKKLREINKLFWLHYQSGQLHPLEYGPIRLWLLQLYTIVWDASFLTLFPRWCTQKGRTRAFAGVQGKGREMETLIYLAPYNWSARVKQDLMVL